MKRFIDLRDQAADGRFAWYCTSSGRFEMHGDQCCWDTWYEFAADYQGPNLERYRGLTPKWAFEAFNGDALQRTSPQGEFIEWLQNVMEGMPKNAYGGFGEDIRKRLTRL